MRAFEYTLADSPTDAVATASAGGTGARYLGGGTNLLDLMKEDIERPDHLIDVSRLELTSISLVGDVLRMGASAKNTDTANHPLVREHYPLLSQAILAGASSRSAIWPATAAT